MDTNNKKIKKMMIILKGRYGLRLSTATLIIDNLENENKLSLIIEVLFSESLIKVEDIKDFLTLLGR